MSDFIEQLKTNYKNGDIQVKLIFICVGIYLLSALMGFILGGNWSSVKGLLFLHSDYTQNLSQPWSLITYAFFHSDLLHLVFNMLMLYFVGQMFLRYFRKEDFLTFFLFGAIAGGLAFMALSALFGHNSVVIGASASIYALFFALVAYMPKTKVQLMFINIDVPLNYLAYGLLAYDILMILNHNNQGGHFAHLGGAAFGYFYMKQFEKGNDFLGNFVRSIFFGQKRVKLKSEKKSGYQKESKPPRNDYDFNAQKVEKQQRVDAILDKISRSGYDSLTKEEKDFLFKASKNG